MIELLESCKFWYIVGVAESVCSVTCCKLVLHMMEVHFHLCKLLVIGGG